MATERYRMPYGVRAPERVRIPAGAMAPVGLSAPLPCGMASDPHPDFHARAAVWRDHANGLISIVEAQRRSAAIGASQRAAVAYVPKRATVRPRYDRPAPNASRQYANSMATTAARDDRLTPNAKALLQVLRARCGNGRTTQMAKATLATVMSRSVRTIRRYLIDLEHFGYITLQIRKTAHGLHTGLIITITEQVLPFFAEPRALASWLAETRSLAELPFAAENPGSARVTKMLPINQIGNYLSIKGKKLALEGVGGSRHPPG